jgi:hypothetical protein
MNIITNFKHIIKQAFIWTLRVYSIIGILCFFVNIQDLLNNEWTFIKKIAVSIFIFVILFLIMLIATSLVYGLFIRKVKRISTGNKNSVYLCYGDIFKFKRKEQRNIIISVNRCFDTEIDNHLISEKSLHGQLFKKLYKHNYTVSSLNIKLQNILDKSGYSYEQLSISDKPQGNLKRYEVGSIIEFKENLVTYFLLGLTSMDKGLTAHTTLNQYIYSINKLIDYCYAQSQGFPVIMPLIGGGFARVGIKDKDILQLILDLLEINKSKIISDWYIIVNSNISITN